MQQPQASPMIQRQLCGMNPKPSERNQCMVPIRHKDNHPTYPVLQLKQQAIDPSAPTIIPSITPFFMHTIVVFEKDKQFMPW
jgi:hypothetical protein